MAERPIHVSLLEPQRHGAWSCRGGGFGEHTRPGCGARRPAGHKASATSATSFCSDDDVSIVDRPPPADSASTVRTPPLQKPSEKPFSQTIAALKAQFTP
jgi:hypothetical protein